MPELPEVQTTVNGLNKKVRNKKIIDVWTDLAVPKPSLNHFNQTTKSEDFFGYFKQEVIGSTIKRARRRGKNILIDLDNQMTIWIHLKMTGHLMYGNYQYDSKTNIWMPDSKQKNKALLDPYNQFLHTVFSLNDGKQLVLSDVRKFGKVTIFPSTKIPVDLQRLGPEPLDPAFSLKEFKQRLSHTSAQKPIKLALLDQNLIVGIGNIYSDEALWLAGIHPFRKVKDLSQKEIASLFKAIIKSLETGLNLGGDSTSDYRNIDGQKGQQQAHHKAYRQTGKACQKKDCPGIITKLRFAAGRYTHFCPVHQK